MGNNYYYTNEKNIAACFNNLERPMIIGSNRYGGIVKEEYTFADKTLYTKRLLIQITTDNKQYFPSQQVFYLDGMNYTVLDSIDNDYGFMMLEVELINNGG